MESIIVRATPFLRLPYQFDVARMVSELDDLLRLDWKAHYNEECFSGSWRGISFLSPSGQFQDITLGNPNVEEPLKATELLDRCPYFASVLSTFKCTLTSARLLWLRPGAIIKEHSDGQMGYEDGNFRLHIPVKTNDGVEFVLAGEQLVMEPGSCWYTNVNHLHRVVNRGTTDRVHLVIDGLRNSWTDELFFSLAPKEELLASPSYPVRSADRERVLEQLRLMGGPHQDEIIEQLLASWEDSTDRRNA
ncbi:aspartyl/asparaginyl beta-hydroxylase domain-containing protein [Lewinella sp. W8]|uniref:aspartyl/asparaginyl beta-hydroxylase domain-containing protein n=1 Tax=Lewinella sp. W8 TaxID=2528208 RepID=UPI00106799FD|nr:aspartyl/asparaginyl beta-hydroxylase domain-containing protein [Lewinella sp. W8]MTB52176.1 aspartyl/asparaginyl beta-hydroxylase domain-containing protein [Lewinella sp. W8]